MQNAKVATHETKRHAIVDLLDKTTHDLDFYVLLVGAILLALGAIFTDSIPVLIASMIVAPLAYPILALGLGVVGRNGRLIAHALGMLGISCLVAVAISVAAAKLFAGERIVDTYITFSGNHVVAFAVAVVSGVIAAYGMIRPKVGTAITGVAIAVSLMPPLVATGVAYASGSPTIGWDALTLFLLNILGILFASIVMFWLFGMGSVLRANNENPSARPN